MGKMRTRGSKEAGAGVQYQRLRDSYNKGLSKENDIDIETQ